MAAVATSPTVALTINGVELQVPKGELIVESVKRLGLEIPIFCYHPRMKPVGMCRMCLVEVEGMRGLQISCATVVTDGIASMPHAMSIPVPAGETVALSPGGYHGMLMGLTTALKEGDRFPVTLTFEKAGDVTVDVDVLSLRAEGPDCSDAGQ